MPLGCAGISLARSPLFIPKIAFLFALPTAATLSICGGSRVAGVDTGSETTVSVRANSGLNGRNQKHAQEVYRKLEAQFAGCLASKMRLSRLNP